MSKMTDQELTEQGYKRYIGDKIDVYFKAQVCQHSGRCVRGNSKVFNLERRPWIDVNAADYEEIMRLVDNCPSGALQYIVKK